MANTSRVEFDLASADPCFSPYFKSSFARSVAEDGENHSKSLDLSYFNSTLLRTESLNVKDQVKKAHPRRCSANMNHTVTDLIKKGSFYPSGKCNKFEEKLRQSTSKVRSTVYLRDGFFSLLLPSWFNL